MIIHSELDYRLPITEGLAAFNVLQERGVPSKLLVFPDENHWYVLYTLSFHCYRVYADFSAHQGSETGKQPAVASRSL